MRTLSPRDEENIKRYEEILSREPNAVIFAVLGSLYAQKYDFTKAIEVLSKGIKNHPSYFSARTLLAKCYIAVNEADKAERELESVLNIDPYNIGALNLLADLLRDRGKYQKSEELYGKILEIDPENTEVKYKLHILGQLRETAAAEATEGYEVEPGRRRRVPEDEDAGLATITLAKVYEEQGLLEKAAAIAKRVVRDHPDDEQARETYDRIQALLTSESELTGESTMVIADRISAIKGLMEDDEFELWDRAQKRVAESIRAAGITLPALLRADRSFSTSGETVLSVGTVSGESGLYNQDILEIFPPIAELLMVEFDIGDAPEPHRLTGTDVFNLDKQNGYAGQEPRTKRGPGPNLERRKPDPGSTVATLEMTLEDEMTTEPGTETGARETAVYEGRSGPTEHRAAGPRETESQVEVTPRAPESVVKPEMYLPEKTKELEDDPFDEDDDFLRWLNSIKVRDL